MPTATPPPSVDRCALITGGTRGIGLGIAERLASEGWDLVLNGRRPAESVAPALEGLKATGVQVRYVAADIGTPEGRLALSRQLAELPSSLDLLVNNAGVAPAERRDVLEMTPESYQRVLRINLDGPVFLSQIVANDMLARPRSDGFMRSIVNVGSISATVASTSRAEYCIAKAALSMLTQVLAARLGSDGIGVYEVRPGVTLTDMTSAVREKYDAMLAQGLCVQPRWGTPEDVGRAVAALARGDFPYSTGQVVLVDGGLTLPRL